MIERLSATGGVRRGGGAEKEGREGEGEEKREGEMSDYTFEMLKKTKFYKQICTYVGEHFLYLFPVCTQRCIQEKESEASETLLGMYKFQLVRYTVHICMYMNMQWTNVCHNNSACQ